MTSNELQNLVKIRKLKEEPGSSSPRYLLSTNLFQAMSASDSIVIPSLR